MKLVAESEAVSSQSWNAKQPINAIQTASALPETQRLQAN